MPNVGSLDRLLRVVVGIVLVCLPFIPSTAAALTGLGSWAWALPVVGLVLLATAALRFCPAYTLLGIRTCATPRDAS